MVRFSTFYEQNSTFRGQKATKNADLRVFLPLSAESIVVSIQLMLVDAVAQE